MKKVCDRCGTSRPVSGERYCKACRKAVLTELNDSGYLTPRTFGHVGIHRPDEAKEQTYETKHGTGHG
jgi:hypothetical protein